MAAGLEPHRMPRATRARVVPCAQNFTPATMKGEVLTSHAPKVGKVAEHIDTVSDEDILAALTAALESGNVADMRAVLTLAITEEPSKLAASERIVNALDDDGVRQMVAEEVAYRNTPDPINMSALTLFSATGGRGVPLADGGRTLDVHPVISRTLRVWLKSWETSDLRRSNGDKLTLWTFSGDRNKKLAPPVATLDVWDTVQHIKAFAEQNGYHVGKPRMLKRKGADTREFISVTARDKDGKAIISASDRDEAAYFTCYAGVADK